MLTIVKLPRLLLIPLALLLTHSLLPLPAAPPKSPAKKSAPQAKSAGPQAKTNGAAKAAPKGSGAKTASGKGRSRRTTAAARRPATQQQPDQQRIREIQQALSAKGYPVEASGVWGPESIEALKKFQEDQNINNMSGRGKLDSLTLIGLGLGPQRGTSPLAAGPETRPETEGKNP
jgi:hypothetical protein